MSLKRSAGLGAWALGAPPGGGRSSSDLQLSPLRPRRTPRSGRARRVRLRRSRWEPQPGRRSPPPSAQAHGAAREWSRILCPAPPGSAKTSKRPLRRILHQKTPFEGPALAPRARGCPGSHSRPRGRCSPPDPSPNLQIPPLRLRGAAAAESSWSSRSALVLLVLEAPKPPIDHLQGIAGGAQGEVLGGQPQAQRPKCSRGQNKNALRPKSQANPGSKPES